MEKSIFLKSGFFNDFPLAFPLAPDRHSNQEKNQQIPVNIHWVFFKLF